MSASTGIRLAELHFSSALVAKTSISARRAFHYCLQLRFPGQDKWVPNNDL